MTGIDKNIMIIAGEVSGDLHGSALVSELIKIDPGIKVCGIGGDKMKEAGMEIIYHIDRMAFLGFVEVLEHLPFIKKVQKHLLKVVHERMIKTVVLIDYPGFNLNIAKKLKARGIKIVYYISPQIWAWGAGRIKKIKRLIDKMLVVFPFEEKFYLDAGIDVEYVGHPLAERVEQYNFTPYDMLIKNYGLDEEKDILLILPGSRENEVKKIFPESIKAAGRIADHFNMQIAVACSNNIDEKIFYKISKDIDFTVIKNKTYDLLKYAKLGIVKSGTSTLEAGLFKLPMVIVYKTSFLTYVIGKRLIKVKNIGLANIVMEEKAVPELIQDEINEERIFEECSRLLSDREYYHSIKNKLGTLKEKLGTIGASTRAAKSIYKVMNET